MLTLAAYERGICKCGFHKAVTADKRNRFTFGETTCAVCAGAEQYGRIQAEADSAYEKNLGENPGASTPRPTDGRETYAQLLNIPAVPPLPDL